MAAVAYPVLGWIVAVLAIIIVAPHSFVAALFVAPFAGSLGAVVMAVVASLGSAHTGHPVPDGVVWA